ncbi:hypothetical protein [Actinoplanes sp. NPDC049265]|uniref:hypothetical protein n=1 Tax=Actinoplanes sp. NPDC049265 TaxID=3363902 RepID=UPI00371F57DC
MTQVLDLVAAFVARILGVFGAGAASFLFLPVFILTVVIGFVLVVQKLGGFLSRTVATVVTWAVAGAGAVLLLAELVVADGYRRRGARAPAVVYNLGDMVASWAAGLTTAVRNTAATVGGALGRANGWLLILISLGLIWYWNYQHCPEGAAGCARPVSAWVHQIGTSDKP